MQGRRLSLTQGEGAPYDDRPGFALNWSVPLAGLAGVAQLVEQLIRNQQVTSSSLVAGSNRINRLQRRALIAFEAQIVPGLRIVAAGARRIPVSYRLTTSSSNVRTNPVAKNI